MPNPILLGLVGLRVRRRWRRRVRRTVLLGVLIVGFLAGAAWIGAVRGHADPSGTDWQITPTAGLQTATDSTGHQYPYVVLPTSGRWYLECPMRLDPGTHQLQSSILLNLEKDRCGNDQGATRPYAGATWQTTSFASVNVDPQDLRCGQLVAHRADAMPPDAVSQPFCGDRVLVYPTSNSTLADQLATWWPEQVLDSCPAPKDRSTLACGPKDDRAGSVALQWWHRAGGAGVDCARIPAGHVPASISGWAAGDPGQLIQACQVMDNYFTGAALHFVPSTDLLAAVRQALQESGPAKQPPWAHAVRGSDVKTSTKFDWTTVAGAVGGCLAGGAAGGLAGGPPGMVIGCLAGGVAGAAAANWLEGKDCALTSWHCIINAITRWMGNGFIDELKWGLNQLTHGLDPTSLFGQDAFIRLWQALVLISAFLGALYALLSLGVAMAIMRPSLAMTTVRNIFIWGWALAAALPFLKLVLTAVDGLTSFICSWGAGSSWTDLSGRFQSVMQVALISSLPTGGATAGVVVLLLLIIGGVAAMFMAAWAFGRAAAIALAALGIPIAASALTGPPAMRRGPQTALSILFGLIVFKPLVAIVFLLGLGLMGSGTGSGAFLVGLLCLLGAAFVPWRIIRLFGTGIDHGANGSAGHSAVTAGAAAVGTVGGRALYSQGRGLWHRGSGSGPGGNQTRSWGGGARGTGPVGQVAGATRRGTGGSGPGGSDGGAGRDIPKPPHAPTGGGGAGAPASEPGAPNGAGVLAGSRVPTSPARPPAAPPGTGSNGRNPSPATTASDVVARHRAGDRT